MTVELVHRPARTSRPLDPPAAETVAAPPVAEDRVARGVPWSALLPVTGALASGLMIVLFRSGNPAFLLVGAMVLVVALVGGVGMALSHRGGAGRHAGRTARTTSTTSRGCAADAGPRPRPAHLGAAARPRPGGAGGPGPRPGPAVGARAGHPDFLDLRVGVGDQARFDLRVPPEQDPVHPYDPILLGEAVATAGSARSSAASRSPSRWTASARSRSSATRDEVLAVARSLLLQVVALHAPDDLALAAAFPADRAEDWRGSACCRT